MRYEKKDAGIETEGLGKGWIKFGVWDTVENKFILISFAEAFIDHKVEMLNNTLKVIV